MTGSWQRLVVVGGAIASAVIVGRGPDPAMASTTVTITADAPVLATALVSDPSWVVGAEIEAAPPGGVTTGVVTGEVPGLGSGEAVILSTGRPTRLTEPNTSGSSGDGYGGGNVRGTTDFDVTVLRIDLAVPAGTNCLTGLDFVFLSDEYPEYVGSSFNDAFVAELDSSTWTTSGSTIIAPDNFAFDPDGATISINATGVATMAPEFAVGTTFDGATPALRAATPITPGPHSLYLSIFDQGDAIYDSAVIVDNLQFGFVGDVERDCSPGVVLADETKYFALGDSYSSGFGVSPYEPGTNNDPGPNDCQRSTRAYSQVVAADLDLDLSFHACQGGVTQDFYQPRNDGAWGELPQLDYLGPEAGLITFTIGGNDAKFADSLAECILGFELLPFNTCSNDDKVTRPTREAFERLDGRAAAPVEIVPYNTIFRDIRRIAPFATVVGVGYPPFFTSEGSDRTFLPGGRCEGVKKADQRWIVEKIDELNDIIESNARRNGYLFADAGERFQGHQLCGGDTEWFYPLLSGGRIHPTAEGHEAIALEIEEVLADDGYLRAFLLPGEAVVYQVLVEQLQELLDLITFWDGSDFVMSLETPSGRVITRSTGAPDVFHENGPGYEQYEITDPEPGVWNVTILAADVPPGGEEVRFTSHQEGAPNQRPVGQIDWTIEGGTLLLDGSSSTDPDGEITAHDWYVASASDDAVYVGAQVAHEIASPGPLQVTLVVTDDGGLTDFVTVRIAPVDIMPGSDRNPVNPSSSGVLPAALLSSPVFDATTVDTTTLQMGPGGATLVHPGGHVEDVDGDGLDDLVMHFPVQDLGLADSTNWLCITGLLPDDQGFEACDGVQIVGKR